jgi:single-strand DNA-binding protein
MLNKVTLIGNLGKDPEIRTMQSGDKVANFSLATSERWKDKTTGERKEKTEWHRVVVFNQGLVKVIEGFVKKGSKLYLEGQLETRKWTDKDGVEKYSTEVALRPFKGELVMLDSRTPIEQEDVDRPENPEPASERTVSNDIDDEDIIPF